MLARLILALFDFFTLCAGGKGATFSSDLLKLLYNATAIANVADNAASAPLTAIFVSAHTADPLAAGSQTTSECAYTSYARVSVARTTGGWTVTGASVSPFAIISFPACTGGTESITHGMTGSAVSGTGKQFHRGPVGPNIAVANGVTPQLTTASAFTEA